jgi:hypothetical protein
MCCIRLQERDWDASSADEDDDDPRCSAWAVLMHQSTASQAGATVQCWDSDQQDMQQQSDAEWQEDGSAAGQSMQQIHVQQSRCLSADVALLPVDVDPASAASASAGAANTATGGGGEEFSSLSLVSAVSTSTAAAVAIAAAAAVAGPEFASPELSPGNMLGQRLGKHSISTACAAVCACLYSWRTTCCSCS